MRNDPDASVVRGWEEEGLQKKLDGLLQFLWFGRLTAEAEGSLSSSSYRRVQKLLGASGASFCDVSDAIVSDRSKVIC